MANNQAFVDAIIAGAGGGAQTAWLSSTDPTVYNSFSTSVNAIAAAVDALIPPIVPGPSLSQIQLMQSITNAVFGGRYTTNLSWSDIATRIVVLYTKLAVSLGNIPNIYASAPVGIGGVYVVDNIAAPLTGRTGSLTAPFATLQEAVNQAVIDGRTYPVILVTPQFNDTTPLSVPDTGLSRVSFIGIGRQSTISGTIDVAAAAQTDLYFQDIIVESTAVITYAAGGTYAPPNIYGINSIIKCAISKVGFDLNLQLISSSYTGTFTANNIAVLCDDYSYQHLINATIVGTPYYGSYGVGGRSYTGTLTIAGLAIGAEAFVTVPVVGVLPDTYAVPRNEFGVTDFVVTFQNTITDGIVLRIKNISRASTNFSDTINFQVMNGTYIY